MALTSKTPRLPSLPTVAVRLLQRFGDPNVTLANITDIVRPDPAITASMLRAAGSAAFGVGRPLTDLTRAVSLLGIRRVTSLALCFSLNDDSMKSGPLADLYRRVWQRSIVQAIAAKLLAKRRARGAEAEHFTAGLLADIGRLALLKSAPEEYAAIAEQADSRPELQTQLEQEAFGTTHDDLAISFFKQWKLPVQFCESVRNRNASTDDLLATLTGEHRPICHGIALASSVATMFCENAKGAAFDRTLDLCETLYAMSSEDTQEFLETVRTRLEESAELFRLDVSHLGSAAEIMSLAREQLNRDVTARDDSVEELEDALQPAVM